MKVEARVDKPISPHCYVESMIDGLRGQPFVWVEAPPRAFPLAEQEAKRKAWKKGQERLIRRPHQCGCAPLLFRRWRSGS
eukprot:837335-Pyramimonas_sp.AAC.1